VWQSLADFDLTAPDQLPAVRPAPRALVIHGRQDPIPLASSEQYALALDARFVVLEDCGHVPYVEQPDALFAEIGGFLR
jgi:proline iminopeptidase